MTVGNGVMAAFAAKDKEKADRIARRAVASGHLPDAPGWRGERFDVAYFLGISMATSANAFVTG